MRYIDLIGQSVILLLCVIFSVMQFFQDGAPIMAILIAGFYLGVWQMISALISLIVQAPFVRQKSIHFVIAVVFLSLTPLVGRYGEPNIILTVLIFAIPTALAMFYYYITWRWALTRQRKTGKFLPNVFF